MESIDFLSNGQWLLKAVPKYESSGYFMDQGNPEHQFSGKEALRLKNKILSRMSEEPKGSIKHAINPKTNKEEPHIMLHRGIKAGQEGPNAERYGNQKFHVTDDSAVHEGIGVHTPSYNYASDYGDVHSFWVPISDIKSYDAYALENNDRNKEHVVVGTGKYSKVSPDELKSIISENKIRSEKKQKTQNLNARKILNHLGLKPSKKLDQPAIDALSALTPEKFNSFNEDQKKQVLSTIKNII